MPFKQQQFVTADGWVVDLTLSNEIIDHIDNLAGASNSWQARVSLRSEVNITGGGAVAVQDGQLETGYFVGCRTDSSPGVELGGHLGASLTESASISEGAAVAGGVGTVLPWAPLVAGAGAGAGVGATQGISSTQAIGGSIRVLLKPGGLAQVPIDRINLRDSGVVSEFNNQNLEADGCGGQVKIQSYATVKIRTKKGNNTQTIYGDPKDL